jgi:ubiquinone/menaquinone biosynthesis C-methylase UbiE
VDRRLSRPLIRPFFTTCDVGGRCGIDAIPFANLADFSFLLDIRKEAVDIGRNIATKLGLKPKMAFVRCSALNLPFKNEVFNLVTSFSVLDHVPGENSLQKAIEEMARVACNYGYVVVTVPNRLFVIGNITRRIIMLMGDPYLEIHFTPKEIKKSMLFVGLVPFLFDAKYPTKIGKHIISHHLPKFVTIIPAYILQSFLRIWEKIFLKLEKGPFKMFGARIGYASQKRVRVHAKLFPSKQSPKKQSITHINHAKNLI